MSRFPFNLAYGLILSIVILTTGCSDLFQGNGESEPTIDNDLNVGFIKRLPEIDYVPGSDNPSREGWPEAGQTVTWQAHIVNWDQKSYEDISYSWQLDGQPIAEGTVTLSAMGITTVELEWDWEFTRHELTFSIDDDQAVTEYSEKNNSLMIYTDALSVGLYVEQDFYDFFHENQHQLSIGSNSFEDYAQRSFAKLNELFEESVYPSVPNGVLDRVRIDHIHVVENGGLPLDKSVLDDPTFNPTQAKPNINDRTVDMQWGFPNERLESTFVGSDLDNYSSQFYIDNYVMHEVMHARYLLDNYGTDIYHGVNNGWVAIKEDGVLIAGTRYLTGTPINYNGKEGISLFDSKHEGLMSGINNLSFSEYSVLALNDIAGNRALTGNYNPPPNEGSYLNYLPDSNRLRLLSELDDTPIANARVDIFQSSLVPDQYLTMTSRAYDEYFDNEADITLQTDSQGIVELGQNPFSNSGPVVMGEVENSDPATYYSNATIILRVESETGIGYTFLEAFDFNREYLRGNIRTVSYEMNVQMIDK